MIIGWTTLDFRHQRVFALFLNDLGTTTDDKLFLRQSLASGPLRVSLAIPPVFDAIQLGTLLDVA